VNEIKVEISVSHFPPGTSKWNKIEHRMFNHISMNWKGRPLTSYEVVVSLIAATTSKNGLRIQSELDENVYQNGIAISKAQLSGVNIHPAKFRGEWNYSMHNNVST
jgi:hypothetical protein